MAFREEKCCRKFGVRYGLKNDCGELVDRPQKRYILDPYVLSKIDHVGHGDTTHACQ